MRTRLAVFFLLLAASCLAVASSKVPQSAWQTGTLKGITETTLPARPSAGSGNNRTGIQATLPTRVRPIVQYTIEGPDYVYEAFLVLGNPGEPHPAVTINTPIKFAVVKSKFYITDQKGKQYQLSVSKKTPKPPAS